MRFILIIFSLFFSSTLVSYAQVLNQDDEKALMEQRVKLLRKAKIRESQTNATFGYHGGTMAGLGATLYTLNLNNIGFYASIRTAINTSYKESGAYKTLALNAGITSNITYPVAFYVAGGISDYQGEEWEFGVDTSTGLIWYLGRNFKAQTGISLMNFQYPEFCFGIGINLM